MSFSQLRSFFAGILFLSLLFGISSEVPAQFIDTQSPVPFIMNGRGNPEPWEDIDIRDGKYQLDEPFTDINSNGYWDSNPYVQDKSNITRRTFYIAFTCTDDSIIDRQNSANILYKMQYSYLNPFTNQWSEYSHQNYAVITVPPNKPAGKYTVRVKARDTFGNETHESLSAKADLFYYIYRSGVVNLVSHDTLTANNAGWTPDTLIGMTLNPNIDQGTTFTVVSNTSSTLVVDNSYMDLHRATQKNKTFWLIMTKIAPPQLHITDIDGATGEGKRITLSWTPVGTVVENFSVNYDVYRDGSRLDTDVTTPYTDSNNGAGLINGQTYEYYVVAKTGGIDSGKSNIVKAAPIATASAYRSKDVLVISPDQINLDFTMNTASFTLSNAQRNNTIKFSLFPFGPQLGISYYSNLRLTDLIVSAGGNLSTIVDTFANFKPDSLAGYMVTVRERFADRYAPMNREGTKYSGNRGWNSNALNPLLGDIDFTGDAAITIGNFQIIANTKTTLTVMGDASNLGGPGGGGPGSYYSIGENIRDTAVSFDKVYGEVTENTEEVILTIDRKQLRGGISNPQVTLNVLNDGRNWNTTTVLINISEGLRVAVEERNGYLFNYTNTSIEVLNSPNNPVRWGDYSPNLFQNCFINPDISELPFIKTGGCPEPWIPFPNWYGNVPYNYLISSHVTNFLTQTIINVEIPESTQLLAARSNPRSFGMAVDRRIYPDPSEICDGGRTVSGVSFQSYPNQFDPLYPDDISTAYSDKIDPYVFAPFTPFYSRTSTACFQPWINCNPHPDCWRPSPVAPPLQVTFIWDAKIYNNLEELAGDIPTSRLVDTDPDFPPPTPPGQPPVETGVLPMGIPEDEMDMENPDELLTDWNGNGVFDDTLYWNMSFLPNASDLTQTTHYPITHVYPPETLTGALTFVPGEAILIDNDCDCIPDDVSGPDGVPDGVLDDWDGSYVVDVDHYSIGDGITSDNMWNPPTEWNDYNENCIYDMVPVIRIDADLRSYILNGTLDSYVIYDADGDNSMRYVEEYIDANANDRYDLGEQYADTNRNGQWDLIAYHYGDRRFHISPSMTDIMIGATIGDTTGKNGCGTPLTPLLHAEGGEPINDFERPADNNSGVRDVWNAFNYGAQGEPKNWDLNGNGEWDSGYLEGLIDTQTLYTVLEPGDIVPMYLKLANYSDIQATSLSIIVAEYDPYITILGNNVVTVDNVLPMNVVTTAPDASNQGQNIGPAIYFSISESTPCNDAGYTASFFVKVVDSRALNNLSSLDREAMDLYDTMLNIKVVRAGPIEFIPGNIDDDDAGYSRGDGDGIIEAGEQIEFSVKIKNEGCETFGTGAQTILLTLIPEPDTARFIQFQDPQGTQKQIATLDPGEEGYPGSDIDFQEPDFEFSVSRDYDGRPLQFTLAATGPVTFGSAPPTHAIYMNPCIYTFTRDFTYNPNISKIKFWKLRSGRIDTLYDERLVDEDANYTPDALAGLKLNPNMDQSAAKPITFDIVSNTETSITVNTSTTTMLGVAKNGDYYAVLNPMTPDIFREGETVFIELDGEPQSLASFNFFNITFPDDPVNVQPERNRKFFANDRVLFDDGTHMDKRPGAAGDGKGDGLFGGFYTFKEGDDGQYTVVASLARGNKVADAMADDTLLVDISNPLKPENLSADMVPGLGFIRLDWEMNKEFDVQFCELAAVEIYRSDVPYDFTDRPLFTARYVPPGPFGFQQDQDYYIGPEEPYYDANFNGQYDAGETFDPLGGHMAWDDGPYFTDTSMTLLDFGYTFYYTIRVIDVFNNPSEFSNVAAVTFTQFNPADPTEADALPNDWETRYGLLQLGDLDTDNADQDPDNDGLTNFEEYMYTFTNPLLPDTDYSGEVDGSEFDTSLAYTPISDPVSLNAFRYVTYSGIDGRDDSIIANVVPGGRTGVFQSVSGTITPGGPSEDNVMADIYSNWRKHAFKGFTLYMGRGTKFVIRDNDEHSITVTGEPFEDVNANGVYDPGEPYRDVDGDGQWNTNAHLQMLFHDGIGRYWIDGESKVDTSSQIVADISSAAGIDPLSIAMEVNGAPVDAVNNLDVKETFTKQYGNLVNGMIDECYVVDSGAGAIDQITGTAAAANDGTGPVINTLTPSNSTYNNPRGVAVDPYNRTIWVLDTNNNRVVKYAQTTVTGSFVEVLAITGFNSPQDIEIDRNTGSCWVADTGNKRVVRLDWDIENNVNGPFYYLGINTGGHTSMGYPNFQTPVALSVNQYPYPTSEAGTCWVVDTGMDGAFKIDPSNNYIVKQVWGFDQPTDIDVDLFPGAIWVVDRGNNRVVRLTPHVTDNYMATGNSGNYHDSLPGLDDPRAVSVNWIDETAWIATYGRVYWVEFNEDTSNIDVKTIITGFREPSDVAVNPFADLENNSGNCWVSEVNDLGEGQVVLVKSKVLKGVPTADINDGGVATILTGYTDPQALFVNDASAEAGYRLTYTPPNVFLVQTPVHVTLTAKTLGVKSRYALPNGYPNGQDAKVIVDSFDFTTIENDTDGPIIELQQPAANSTGVNPNTNIVFLVYDKTTDVEQSSIKLYVNGSPYTPLTFEVYSEAGKGDGYLVTWTNPPLTDFAVNTKFNCRIEAKDIASEPNPTFFNFTFTTRGEQPTAAPFIYWPTAYPAPNTVLTSIYVPLITATVLDAGSDVDPSTIQMFLLFDNNIVDVTPFLDITRHTGFGLTQGQGYDLTYNISNQNPFKTGSAITVCVYACDDTGEDFTDANGNGFFDAGEPYEDIDLDGMRDPNEPYTDENSNGVYDSHSEPFNDANGNGKKDALETYTDENGNGQYDYVKGEDYIDVNGNSQWDAANCMNPGVTAESCWGFSIANDISAPLFSELNPLNGESRINPANQTFVIEFLVTDLQTGVNKNSATMELLIQSIFKTIRKTFTVTENASTGLITSPAPDEQHYRFSLYGYMLSLDYNSQVTINLSIRDKQGNEAQFSGWSFTTLDKSPPKFGVTSPRCLPQGLSGVDMNTDIIVQVKEQERGDTGIDYNTSYIDVTYMQAGSIIPQKRTMFFSEHTTSADLDITEPSPGDVRVHFNPQRSIDFGANQNVTFKVCAYDLEGNEACTDDCSFTTKPGFPEIEVSETDLAFPRTCINNYQNSQSDLTFNIRNTGLKELDVTSIKSDNLIDFTVVPESITIPPLSQWVTCTVSFHPQDFGPKNGTITIESTDIDTRRITINVSGDTGVRPVILAAGLGYDANEYTKVSESQGGHVAIIVHAVDPNQPTSQTSTPTPTPSQSGTSTPTPSGSESPTPTPQGIIMDSTKVNMSGTAPIGDGRINACLIRHNNDTTQLEMTCGTISFLTFARDSYWLDLGMAQWIPISSIPAANHPNSGGEGAFAIDDLNHRIFYLNGPSGGGTNYIGLKVFYAAGPNWDDMSTSGDAPGYINGKAAFDVIRSRVIYFGGEVWPDGFKNDTYSLDITSGVWSQLTTSGQTPSGRRLFGAVFNSNQDGMVIFGGLTASGVSAECYLLQNAAPNPFWVKLPDAPTPRESATVLYDKDKDRMYVFGGSNGSTMLDTMDAFDFATQTWLTVNITGEPPTARKGAAGYYAGGDNWIAIYGGEFNGIALNDVYWLDIPAPLSRAPQTSTPAPVKRIDVYLDGVYQANIQPHNDGLNGDWSATDNLYTYIWDVNPGEMKQGEHIVSLKAIENYCEYDSIEWPYAVMESSENTPGTAALLMDTYPELYFDAPTDFDTISLDFDMAPQNSYPLNIMGGIAKIELDPTIPSGTSFALMVEVRAQYLLLGCMNIEFLDLYLRDITGIATTDEYMGEEWRLTKHQDPVKRILCYYYVSKPFTKMPGTYLVILQGKNLDGTPSKRYPFLTVDP